MSCHGAITSSSSTDEVSQKSREHNSKDLYSLEAYYKKLQTLADSRDSRKDEENESEISSKKKESSYQLDDEEMGWIKQVSNIKRPKSPRLKRRQTVERKAKVEGKKAPKHLPKNDKVSLESLLVF